MSNIKVFGPALAATLTISAVIAAPAFATPFSFKAEKVQTQLTAKQHAGNDVLALDTGKLECAEVAYAGEQKVSPTGEYLVTPTYSGCTVFGFANTPIDLNSCQYRFKTVTKEFGNFEGSFDIVCPVGKVIEITSFGCTVTIGSQSGLKKVTYTNLGAGTTREITIDLNLAGIKYEEHQSGIFDTCASHTVPKSNGTYVGALIVTGEDPITKAHRGIFVE
jgi:hypothetical protein